MNSDIPLSELDDPSRIPRRDRARRPGSLPGIMTMTALALACSFGEAHAVPDQPPARKGASPKNETPPIPRCYPPSGETVSAQKIMRDLIEGRNVDLQSRIIDGSLDADSSWPAADDRKTTLRVIPGRLRLDGCRVVGHVALSHVVLQQDLIMTCCEVMGEVDLTDTDVRGGFTGDQTRFLGQVRMNRLNMEGDLSFKNTFFEAGLEMTGGRFHNLSLFGTELQRDLEITHTVLTSLDAKASKVGGAMRLEDLLVLKTFRITQSQVERGLTASSVRISGPMDLTDSHGTGTFALSDVTITGPMTAPLTDATPLSMTDVSVGNLAILDGHFADVSMQRVTVSGPTGFEGARFSGNVSMSECDFGKSFHATEALFERDAEFRKVIFPGEDPMEGALFARAPLLIETILPRPPTVMSDEEPEDDQPADDAPGDDDEEELEPGQP